MAGICRLGAIAPVPSALDRSRRAASRLARADPLLLTLAVLAAGLYAYVYVIDPGRPGELEPLGWFNSSDQGAYLLQAREMADFRFSTFAYGPGYPALAVPFLWLGLDYDPFAAVNGLVFVFVAVATFVTARRLSGSRALGAVAGYGLVFASPLVVYVDKPWNSTVSLLAASVILLLATSPRPRDWHPWVMGLMVGAGFAARYVDALWLGAIVVAALLSGPARGRWWRLLTAAAGTAILVLPVLYAQDRIFGSPFTTPYARHLDLTLGGSDQDLGAYDLGNVPDNAFGMLVSPFLRGARFGGQPFLQGMFWSLLAIPGAVLALRRGRPRRLLVATASGALVVAFVFYLSFRGAGTGSVQYGGLHYFKMWWPLLAMLSAVALGAIAAWRPQARRAAGS